MTPHLPGWHCSGLPDRTTLRPLHGWVDCALYLELFRSSGPDYIETHPDRFRESRDLRIVPVFRTGLH